MNLKNLLEQTKEKISNLTFRDYTIIIGSALIGGISIFLLTSCGANPVVEPEQLITETPDKFCKDMASYLIREPLFDTGTELDEKNALVDLQTKVNYSDNNVRFKCLINKNLDLEALLKLIKDYHGPIHEFNGEKVLVSNIRNTADSDIWKSVFSVSRLGK